MVAKLVPVIFGLCHARKTVVCDVGIIGGGPSGTYSAYKLTQKTNLKVCLFEKEKVLGGRMRDVSTRPFEETKLK